MKKSILVCSAAIIMFGSSCSSSSEKVEAAKENVQEAKNDLSTEIKDSTAKAVHQANEDEWKIFKKESEIKIKDNEILIIELKSKQRKNGNNAYDSYSRSVDTLEQKNKNLQYRMDNYPAGKTDWETFKVEFNKDMDGLGSALKNFTHTNNKKK